MAAGADLMAVLGPMTDEQARRVVTILRLGPGQQRRSQAPTARPTDTPSPRAA